MRPSKHELQAGLVNALYKFREVCKQRELAGFKYWNDVNLMRDMKAENELSVNERNNFSKLAFLGLVKHKYVNGKRKRGRWEITSSGVKFLKGELRIQPIVYTFNRKIVRHDGKLVGIQDFANKLPRWQADAPEEEVLKLTQQTLA